MTTENKEPLAVIETLAKALEKTTEHISQMGDHTPDSFNSGLIRCANNCHQALAEARAFVHGRAEAVPNRCVSELLEFAEKNPGTYIFPNWDGSRVAKYLRLMPTHPQASEPAPSTLGMKIVADESMPANELRIVQNGKTVGAITNIAAPSTAGDAPNMDDLPHQDNCRWWKHGDLCDCGAAHPAQGERAEAAISLNDAWLYFTGAEPSLSRLGQAIERAAALLSAPALPVGELPSNVPNVMRRIRACESETAAQVVLEYAMTRYAVEYANSVLAAARTQPELVPMTQAVGEVQHLHELNDIWLEKLPIGTKLYTHPSVAESDLDSCYMAWQEDFYRDFAPPPVPKRDKLVNAAKNALSALEYHQEQTRPIERTQQAIATLQAELTREAMLAPCHAAKTALKAAGWQPIESAPEDKIVAVGWIDSEGHEHRDFDYLDDGVWQRYFDSYEHLVIAGAPGRAEDAPYTYWMDIAPLPAAHGITKKGVEQ